MEACKLLFNWLGKVSQIKHLLSDGKLSERALRLEVLFEQYDGLEKGRLGLM